MHLIHIMQIRRIKYAEQENASDEELKILGYSTFVKVGDKVWKYCGNCFPGESVDIESEDKR